jgi:predicted metal-dependent hydrolase
MSKEAITAGGLVFEVRRSARRRTVALTVDRSGQLVVHAPQDTLPDGLTAWVSTKLLWVHRKLAMKERMLSKAGPARFISGEGFSYLGRNYRLRIVKEGRQPLRLESGWFILRRADVGEAPAHFRRWYIAAGKEWIESRVRGLAPRVGKEPEAVAVRDLGSRWGSCTGHCKLLFNWRLLQLPVDLIEYVIVHELAHLAHRRHDAAFWQAVERALPDWQDRKERLHTSAREYLRFDMTISNRQ